MAKSETSIYLSNTVEDTRHDYGCSPRSQIDTIFEPWMYTSEYMRDVLIHWYIQPTRRHGIHYDMYFWMLFVLPALSALSCSRQQELQSSYYVVACALLEMPGSLIELLDSRLYVLKVFSLEMA